MSHLPTPGNRVQIHESDHSSPGSNLAPPIIPCHHGQVTFPLWMFIPLFGKCGQEQSLSLQIIMSMIKQCM